MNNVTIVLRELRIKSRKTQGAISDKLGISQSQYNKIENGEKALDFEMLAKLAPIFGMSPRQLFNAIYIEDKPARVYVINGEAGNDINKDYKQIATYFEQKFLKIYHMYTELATRSV